jgi:beta-galactosidase
VETTGGVLPLQYQWLKDDNPISAPSLSSCTIASVDSSHAGGYSVVVTDKDGAVQTSGTGTLSVADHVKITTAPAGGQETVGATHTFSVSVTGGYPPLTYVWKKNGTEISGAATASFVTPQLTLSDSGTYTVEIMDLYGDSQSASADLTVTKGVPVAGMAGLGGLLGLIILSGARRVGKR